MRAIRIHRLGPVDPGFDGLRLDQVEIPQASRGELLLNVHYCGVCHTELDEIEGRAAPAGLPMIPGHQVIARVESSLSGDSPIQPGQWVGVSWFFSSCGKCDCCRSGRENLCAAFQATGRDAAGGYAERMVAPADSVVALPTGLEPECAAPLLCAGAVGYRALRMCELQPGDRLGLTGFGSSARLVLSMARALYPDSEVWVFARDPLEREIAQSMGAVWTGDTSDTPGAKLAAIIDTTPAWLPVVRALDCLQPGGRLVINAIRKQATDQAVLLELDYGRHLWMEKSVRSVANVTLRDVRETLELAARIQLRPDVEVVPLSDALDALWRVKSQGIRRSLVLQP